MERLMRLGIQAPTRQAPTSQLGGSKTQSMIRPKLEALHRPEVRIESKARINSSNLAA